VIEADEVYIVAGHKGHLALVKQQGHKGRRCQLRSARGRGHLGYRKTTGVRLGTAW